jgi:hypothetical protein
VQADIRKCEQCGTPFVPQREHARFCTALCRGAWNSEQAGDLAADASALSWSVIAMGEGMQQLSQVGTDNLPRAFTVITEAVWWVTIVDATLVRHHPEPYESVMAAQAPAQRDQIEGTLAGLRFVRNKIGGGTGLREFAGPGTSVRHAGLGMVANWTWRTVPESAVGPLPPRGRAWEKARYQGYQSQLAGRTIIETFGRAAAFLNLAAANARIADSGAQAE